MVLLVVRQSLYWRAVHDGATEGYLIGIFQFVAHADAPCYDCLLYVEGLELSRDIEVGGVALHRGA